MQWAEQCLLEIHIHLDGHVHTALFKMDNQKDLLYSPGNSAQCCVVAYKVPRNPGLPREEH